MVSSAENRAKALTSLQLLRPLVRVGLPVAVAVVLVSLAIINIALVKTWRPEREDGVLWREAGATVVAAAVAPDGAAAGAGLHANDVLVAVDGVAIARPAEVAEIVHATPEGRVLAYTVRRGTATIGFRIELRAPPGVTPGL